MREETADRVEQHRRRRPLHHLSTPDTHLHAAVLQTYLTKHQCLAKLTPGPHIGPYLHTTAEGPEPSSICVPSLN
jgi:hypothetical protein